ncbi:MAG: hypothetical protein E4G91_00820 [Candidatus Zixiibacteriota bacterium]|nr:MAG: hypothetical protein E4G91_00820 [candidate division Zixibacteria bacterium]
MYKFRSLIVLAVVLFAAGCTDKSTNYYYNQSKVSSVSGTVLPADSGTVTASGNTVLTTTIGSDGFFTIDSVPPGIYSITVEPLHYSMRVLRNLVISKSSDYSFRGIVLSNYPYPIYRTTPTDDQAGYSVSGDIRFYADERLNLEDLSQMATFDPPLYGVWSETAGRSSGGIEGDAMYSFSNRVIGQPAPEGYMMQLGTTFEVSIPGSVRTLAGVSLGHDVIFSFTTMPLSVNVRIYPGLMFYTVPITNFRPTLEFPVCVNVDSLNIAARFEPAISGLWLPVSYYSDSRKCSDDNYSPYLRFYPTGLLSPDTDYRLIISDEVYLADHVKLSKPDTTVFTTEPLGVTWIFPENGATGIAPSCTLQVIFNTPMDTASVTAGFELREVDGEVVAGASVWGGSQTAMSFAPAAVLKSGSLYRVTILKTAKTAGGVNLKTNFVSYFAVS